MEYRPLGNTGFTISPLSLGTVALGIPYGFSPNAEQAGAASSDTPPTLRQSTRLIHQAIDSGINFIDTARAYGRSEEVLGHALHDRREKVILATKMSGYDAQGNLLRGERLRQHMEESIATSLRLLRTDYVDLLMLHSASVELLQAGEAIAQLARFQERGVARAIGASTYGVAAPRLAIDLGLNALQVAYNILDQRMADDILPLAQRKGVGIVVRSVFLKGVLTPKANELPAHLDALKRQSDKIEAYAQAMTPPQSRLELALRFMLSQPDIATTLIGVRNESELVASLKAAAAPPLSDEILKALTALRWDDEEMLNPSNWSPA